MHSYDDTRDIITKTVWLKGRRESLQGVGSLGEVFRQGGGGQVGMAADNLTQFLRLKERPFLDQAVAAQDDHVPRKERPA